jgi:hypothetical protein
VRDERFDVEVDIGAAYAWACRFRLPSQNETATSNFGHSRARVPEWLHIGAYPHAFLIAGRLQRRYETPVTGHIRHRPESAMGLIAMQKVVGSNPISRFFANALHVGGFGSAWEPETKSNHPRISPLFQALIRTSARNRPDARRLPTLGIQSQNGSAPDSGGRSRDDRRSHPRQPFEQM